MGTARSELARVFEEFKRVPFPEDSDYEEVSEQRAGLVEYDSYVAGLVSTIIGRSRVRLEDLRSDQGFRERLERIVRDNPATAEDAGTYLRYLERIEQLLELARVAARDI